MAAAHGHVDPRLEPPVIPSGCGRLWDAFLVLAATRQSGMGAQPLTLSDLAAFCELWRVRLTPWEVETLIAIDAAALAAAHRSAS